MKKFSKDLETLFYEQKILPIVNSKNLSDDIKIIESLLNSNKSIKCIEITLREENSFINAIKLKERFSHIHFGLGSILNLEMLEKSTNENFDFYVSPGLIPEIISKNLSFTKKADIYYRINKLIDKKLMGEVFKVMLLTNNKTKINIGFKSD